MNGIVSFFAGLGTAVLIGTIAKGGARGLAATTGLSTLDLNSASVADLTALGLDEAMASRIVENRPYRSKLDLVNRFVLGQVEYQSIRDRVSVSESSSQKAIQVAS